MILLSRSQMKDLLSTTRVSVDIFHLHLSYEEAIKSTAIMIIVSALLTFSKIGCIKKVRKGLLFTVNSDCDVA